MAEKNLSAPARSRSGGSAAGVRHIKSRHTERFTVVGNHLTQHPDLSLTAIGLAAHIQSLPDGARIGIKELAKKFAEGEGRIAAALRELAAYGYLVRSKERTACGKVVTRTVFYDNPGAGLRAAFVGLVGEAERPGPPAYPPAVDVDEPSAPSAAAPSLVVDVPAQPAPTPSAKPQLPLPVPKSEPTPEIRRTAAGLLAGLRGIDPRLRLAQRDIQRLVPAVAAWLEQDLSVTDVRRALLTRLPDEPIQHPAGLVAHRLAVLLPPPLPVFVPPGRSLYASPPVTRAPLQTCDGCERAFRSHVRGEKCRECRIEADDEVRIRAVVAAALAA